MAERERILAEMEAKNKALQAKNDELECFAYTVSHSLKSPLFTILGFTQVLENEVALGNTEQAQQHILWIQTAARKMQKMLDDLLELSRIGHVTHPPEEVSLAVHGEKEVLCYVHDNGIGIAPRFQENVFGLFKRLDYCGEGTGVGLARVKRIVEAHEGRTWVESEGEGHGSTFWFTLPQKQPGQHSS